MRPVNDCKVEPIGVGEERVSQTRLIMRNAEVGTVIGTKDDGLKDRVVEFEPEPMHLLVRRLLYCKGKRAVH